MGGNGNMRERMLGDKIMELLKNEKCHLTVGYISMKLGTGWNNIYSAITNLTYSEPLAEDDENKIYMLEYKE
jgi:hypothetical protein